MPSVLRTVGMLCLGLCILLPGCADLSYAPRATPELVSWRTVLGALTWAGYVLWLLYAVVYKLVAFRDRTKATEQLVVGVLTPLLATLAAHTVSGQLGDWLTTQILGWGAPGAVVIVVASAAYGLSGMAGSPLPFWGLYGFIYPREEILPLAVIPALVTHFAVLVYRVSQLRR